VNKVDWVKGSGKEVHWRGSDVTVIEKDSDGKEHRTSLSGWRNGSLMVNSGTNLYITGGQFKVG
jgi:hypothetical protein